MAVEYNNRRGDVYRLLHGKTRTGKPNYYMAKSKRAKGEPAEAIPEGFEIYESPENGTVVLRKELAHKTTADEKAFLEASIRRLGEVEHFIVDREGDALVVYTTDISGGTRLAAELGEFGDAVPERIVQWLAASGNYDKMLRFVLTDEAKRLFTVQRWCFRGSVDDWIFVDGPAELPTLAEKRLPHLGRESFFDVF